MDSLDFDLDRSIAEAWAQFDARLSEVLENMDDSGDLVIDAEEGDPEAGSVSFRAVGDDPARQTIVAEALTNGQLDDAHQLDAERLQLMEESGWEPPTADPGSSGTFTTSAAQEDSGIIADRAIVALRDVYGVPHPVFLAPSQLAEILTDKPIAEIPAGYDAEDVQATIAENPEHLVEMVRRELFDVLGHDPLRDADGDFSVRVGSTVVFIRVTPDAQEVLVFSPLVHDVEGRSRAMEIVNDLNAESRFVRFELIRDRVFVQMSVLAVPFVPAHLHQAVRHITQIADGIDEKLSLRLNGHTTFDASE